jgi:hypothetical protein
MRHLRLQRRWEQCGSWRARIKEPGKTGSQWRILYSLQLPSLMCDFLEVTASGGEGNGESLNRLPVLRHELILADAAIVPSRGLSMSGKGERMSWSA